MTVVDQFLKRGMFIPCRKDMTADDLVYATLSTWSMCALLALLFCCVIQMWGISMQGARGAHASAHAWLGYVREASSRAYFLYVLKFSLRFVYVWSLVRFSAPPPPLPCLAGAPSLFTPRHMGDVPTFEYPPYHFPLVTKKLHSGLAALFVCLRVCTPLSPRTHAYHTRKLFGP